MRVLWFTNVIMAEYAEAVGLGKVNVGGWMPALVDAVRKWAGDVELHIAFKGETSGERWINGVHYISMGGEISEGARRLVQKLTPDVIHVHGTETIALELPDEVLRRPNTLASIQGVINGYAPHYNGELAACELRGSVNIFKNIIRRTGLYQIQESWINRRAKQESDVFAKVSSFAGRTQWDKSWAKFLNPSARYFTIGELMRKPFYDGRRSEGEVHQHVIYSSASMTYPLKGGHWLLRAVACLKKKYPDVELHVAAANPVSKPKGISGRLRWGDYHRYLNGLIGKFSLQGNVKLLGSLSAEEVALELRHAEVFCLPSLCENSPNSLGEAMLMGVPSIATDVGGIKSILKDGKEGLLVPSGDPAVLADAIDMFFSDKKFARECAENARQTALIRYDARNVVAQLIMAYQKVGSNA